MIAAMGVFSLHDSCQTDIPARDVTLLERHNYSPTYPKLNVAS